MAILNSSRNLLIFGGLGVFALGWGGGLLLGALSSADTPPPPAQPQLVDADAYSTSKEGEPADAPKEKSSSLLEQVFGLDDLEEEKPPRPAPKTKPVPETEVKTAPREDSEDASEDLADTILQEGRPSEEQVKLEESPDPAEPERPENPEKETPEKGFLDENPYQ